MGVAAGAHAVRGEAIAPGGETKAPVRGTKPGTPSGASLTDADLERALLENPDRRVTGSSNPPLGTPRVRRNLPRWLNARPVSSTAVEASPMERAQGSGRLVSAANPEAQAVTNPGLGPWKLGEHEGQPVETQVDRDQRSDPECAGSGSAGSRRVVDSARRIGPRVRRSSDWRSPDHAGPHAARRKRSQDRARPEILRLIDSWLKNGAPDDRSIDVGEMTKDCDWSEPGQLFRVELWAA